MHADGGVTVSPTTSNTGGDATMISERTDGGGRAVTSPGGITRAEFFRLLAAVGVAATGLPRAAAAAEGGTLTVGISSDIKTLDPHRSSLDVFRHTIRSAVFEALVFINPDTLHVDPLLASSWEAAPDGLSVTFKLKPGVKFHDGTPLQASDVVFSINRVKDKAIASPLAPQVAQVKLVEAVDAGTVRLTLTAPSPALPANLAAVQIVGEKSIDSIETQPIGTGPFKFAAWAPGDHIRVEKFAGYHVPGRPKLDAVEWRIVPDSQARIAALQDGSLQMAALVEGKDVKQVQGNADIQVITTKPYVLYENFNINTKRAPFNDKRVRQGLAYAFDRDAYTKTVWFGLARPTINPVPPEMAAYLPDSAKLYPFDLAKAEALLKEAGFSKSNPLKMEILTIVGFDSLKAMALILQDNLNRLGHNVTVRELEATVWFDKFVTKPDFDITSDNFNTVPEDPSGMFASPNFAPGSNVNLWNPPGYADLVAKAASETDPAKRVALYQELQRLLLDEMPQITVDHLPLFFLGAKGVSGFVVGPSGIDDYSGVKL
jgi:peptide/nickel transport system substrate-binding protein